MAKSRRPATRRAKVQGSRQYTRDTRRAMDKISQQVLDQSKRLAAIGLVPATPLDLLVSR